MSGSAYAAAEIWDFWRGICLCEKYEIEISRAWSGAMAVDGILELPTFHQLGPNFPGGSQLGDLHVEVHSNSEEKGKAGRN